MLLGTSFDTLAENTVDYWMKNSESLTEADIYNKFSNIRWHEDSTLQLYIHVPFCTQKCTFCAFSGANSLHFNEANNYVSFLIKQLNYILDKSRTYGKPIASVHIGGGSPDLLGVHIGRLLDTITNLPGYSEKTELSVEFSLFSISNEFINEILKFNVTKVSFGVQTLNPEIRRFLRMPVKLRNLDVIMQKLRTSIPIINVDLMTGFPNQTINDIYNDLNFFIKHPHINSISSYLFSQGSAPAFISDVISSKIPKPPSDEEHMHLRLHTYTHLLKNNWKRYGTCTYLDETDINKNVLSMIKGNECIGAHSYNDYLIGIGASAISHIPGLRLENIADFNEWMRAVESNNLPYDFEKCSTTEQVDMALWVFPLKFSGLPKNDYETLIKENKITEAQQRTFEKYINDGLLYLDQRDCYNLTITGEIFMGHLVKNLKKQDDQLVITRYIDEGIKIANKISSGELDSNNNINNRQLNLVD